jgi:hypothetical protein
MHPALGIENSFDRKFVLGKITQLATQSQPGSYVRRGLRPALAFQGRWFAALLEQRHEANAFASAGCATDPEEVRRVEYFPQHLEYFFGVGIPWKWHIT